MSSRKSKYVRGVVGYPSLFVIAGWVGVWFLWPRLPAVPPVPGHLPRPRVVFSEGPVATERLHESPVVFALSSRVGFGAPRRGVSAPDNEAPALVAEPLFLGWPEAAALRPDLPGRATDGLTAAAEDYHPRWDARPVLDGSVTGVATVVVECRGRLCAAGFEVPLPDSLCAISSELWVTEAFVALDADGTVRDVFLEKPSQDAKIDAAVVRALWAGRAPAATNAAAGRVMVSRVMRSGAREEGEGTP
jgi:hypothetical protein